MHKILLVPVLLFVSLWAHAQGFEVSGIQEGYKGLIGETVRVPVRIKNTTDKPLVLLIRKVQSQIGSTQKNFFCLDGNCHEDKMEDVTIRLEAGQMLNSLHIALEAGLVPSVSMVKYLVINKFNSSQYFEFDLNFSVEEKPDRQNIYQSRYVTVKDVYPNPSVDHAYVDYSLTSEHVKAKIRVHNILGNIVGEYDLTPHETLVRIKTDDLNAGIYFYTLYLDNESVMTRKLIVKK
jgi:hypothetical protein